MELEVQVPERLPLLGANAFYVQLDSCFWKSWKDERRRSRYVRRHVIFQINVRGSHVTKHWSHDWYCHDCWRGILVLAV